MKQFTVIAFAAFTGVLAALLLYYLLVTKPGIESEFARMDQVRDDARSVGPELEKAADESVTRAREGFESQATEVRRRALLATALAAGQGAKIAVTERWMTLGKWPSGASEIGWADPSAYANDGARGVAIEADGVIRVDLTDAVAKGASIRLVPTVVESSGMVNWRCEIQGGADLMRFIPQCSSAPDGHVPALIGDENALRAQSSGALEQKP